MIFMESGESEKVRKDCPYPYCEGDCPICQNNSPLVQERIEVSSTADKPEKVTAEMSTISGIHSPQESQVGLATEGFANFKDKPEVPIKTELGNSPSGTNDNMLCATCGFRKKAHGNLKEKGWCDNFKEREDNCIDCKPKQLNKLNNTQKGCEKGTDKQTDKNRQSSKKGCGKPLISEGDTWGICGEECLSCEIHLCKECEVSLNHRKDNKFNSKECEDGN